MLNRQFDGRECTKSVRACFACSMLDPLMEPDRSTRKMSSPRCSLRLKEGTRDSMAALVLLASFVSKKTTGS